MHMDFLKTTNSPQVDITFANPTSQKKIYIWLIQNPITWISTAEAGDKFIMTMDMISLFS